MSTVRGGHRVGEARTSSEGFRPAWLRAAMSARTPQAPTRGSASSAIFDLMRSWLRLLVVLLVAVAVPAQAMVGVTLAHCGPIHARMAVAAAQAIEHTLDGHAVGIPHHRGDDLAAGLTQADQVRLVSAKSAKSGKLSDLAKYKCSSCASCCAGSALPSAQPYIPEMAAAPAVFAEDIVTVDAFATDGPDRPPRARLV